VSLLLLLLLLLLTLTLMLLLVMMIVPIGYLFLHHAPEFSTNADGMFSIMDSGTTTPSSLPNGSHLCNG
jgi:hypothetical protein